MTEIEDIQTRELSSPSHLLNGQPQVTNNCPQFVVQEETTTVHIPMFRPKLPFLNILKESGGSGEVFTIKEITHLVKNYIIAHQLFDHTDPSIVRCGHDKLGKAFQVNSFTVNDAINLFLKNSTAVPDTCIRIRRQLVRRAVPNENKSSEVSKSSNTATSDVLPTVTSTTSGLDQQHVPSAGLVQASESTPTSHQSNSCNSSPSSPDTDNKCDGRKKASKEQRKCRRRTSVSISFGDEVDGMPPACLEVKVNTEHKNGDQEPQESVANIEEDTISVNYDSDQFSFEYEIESESENSSRSSAKDMVVVCRESDVEFWADYSDTETSTDVELSDGDQWVCETCQSLNHPFYRNCGKCWSIRPNWLPESKHLSSDSKHLSDGLAAVSAKPTTPFSASSDECTITNGKRRVRIVSAASSSPGQISEPLLSEDEGPDNYPAKDWEGTSKNDSGVSSFQPSSQELQNIPGCSKGKSISRTRNMVGVSKWHRGLGVDLAAVAPSSDMCVICVSRPKTASIIHGNFGHQVSCYQCAKRLKRKSLPCPVCRRPIQKVVKNFIL